jgi:hypothetical protein
VALAAAGRPLFANAPFSRVAAGSDTRDPPRHRHRRSAGGMSMASLYLTPLFGKAASTPLDLMTVKQ